MNMMKWLMGLGCAAALQLHAAGEQPNVVILYADDMGVADVSYGRKDAGIQTPNLDRLAAEGMTFTDGHSSSGICTPSRFALLTGQHHWRRFHGIVGAFGESVFKPEDFTIAKMFRKQGYRTACFGKWHLGWDWDAIRRPGFDPPRRRSMAATVRGWAGKITGTSLWISSRASKRARSFAASSTLLGLWRVRSA